MIKIQGFHGKVSLLKSDKMETIARVITPMYQWEFDGTIGEFADKWQCAFLAYFIDDSWMVYISDYTTFGQR